MEERLTWEEIKKQYPNQFVGLIKAKYKNHDTENIESAIVKYTEKTISKYELQKAAYYGEIIRKYTGELSNTIPLGSIIG